MHGFKIYLQLLDIKYLAICQNNLRVLSYDPNSGLSEQVHIWIYMCVTKLYLLVTSFPFKHGVERQQKKPLNFSTSKKYIYFSPSKHSSQVWPSCTRLSFSNLRTFLHLFFCKVILIVNHHFCKNMIFNFGKINFL